VEIALNVLKTVSSEDGQFTSDFSSPSSYLQQQIDYLISELKMVNEIIQVMKTKQNNICDCIHMLQN